MVLLPVVVWKAADVVLSDRDVLTDWTGLRAEDGTDALCAVEPAAVGDLQFAFYGRPSTTEHQELPRGPDNWRLRRS